VVRDVGTLETTAEEWQTSKQIRRVYGKNEEWPLSVSPYIALLIES
jgi:hypothetical protein